MAPSFMRCTTSATFISAGLCVTTMIVLLARNLHTDHRIIIKRELA